MNNIIKSFLGITSDGSETKIIASKRATFMATMFGIFCSLYIAVGILSIGAFTIYDFGDGLLWTAGFDVIFFVFLYVLSDLFSETLGFKATRLTGIIATFMSIFTFGALFLVNTFADPKYTTIEGEAGGSSIWGFLPATTLIMTVGGSLIFCIGDWVNDVTHKALHKRHNITPKNHGKYHQYITRTLGSSIIGRFVDLTIFNILIAAPLMNAGMIDWGWGSIAEPSFWITLVVGNIFLAVLLQICLELICSFPVYKLTAWVNLKLHQIDIEAGVVNE